jgi:hypothetical protein
VSRAKGPRPPLDDVDLENLPREIAPMGGSEVRRRAAVASTFESPSFVARGTEAGHIRLVRTATVREESVGTDQRQPVTEAAPASAGTGDAEPGITLGRRLRSEEPNFTVRLPDYVQQALRMRAVSERTTVRLILLRMLRDAGYNVEDQDMTDDRGIVAKMRSKARRP